MRARRVADAATALAAAVGRAAQRPGALRVLLLDLDGTLAPIARTPGEACVTRGSLEALEELVRGGWRVAVVSGRPAAQVRRMVPVRGVRAFGSHGLEGSWDGSRPARLSPALRSRLAALRSGAQVLVDCMPGSLLEVKPAGIALHDRGVPAARLPAWRRRVRAFLGTSDLEGLEVLRGRRVIEVRPRRRHKGSVVGDLLQREASRRRDPTLVTIGDDRTDEDMFREVCGRGLAIRVGPPRTTSLAVHVLPSPAAVGRFLRRLAAISAAAGADRPAAPRAAAGARGGAP